MWWAVVTAALVVSSGAAQNKTRYAFYRNLWSGVLATEENKSRRIFGGAAAQLTTYGAVCALLDRYWAARCSCAVLAPRWALTAAHCVAPHVAYVKYNARRPAAPAGDVAAVHCLYRHPGFKVLEEDEGRGVDITLLQHDVGLVRTRIDMKLSSPPTPNPLHSMGLYNARDLKDEEVQVLGFGRTETSSLGDELFEVRLRLVLCDRGEWLHCVCGTAAGRGARGGARGVCAGDSGGPVLFRGTQVGVTSMGPVECASPRAALAESATSVFTALYNYVELVNATIYNTEAALHMRMVGAAHTACFAFRPLLALLFMLPAR